eukprot:3934767-Rhodomonas_salina.3
MAGYSGAEEGILGRVRGPIVLSACYAMSGTGIVYGARCIRACCAMAGTVVGHAATPIRAAVRYLHRLCCYQASTWILALSQVSAYGMLRDVRYWHSVWLVRPTECYAMSGTDIALGDLARYAMSGTDIAYGPSTSRQDRSRCRSALIYAQGLAMRCPVLT